MKRISLIYIFILLATSAYAQADRRLIREGNRLYRQQKFDKAETDYRKATQIKADNPQAIYNLGCALMQQQKDSAAIEQFEKAGKLEKNKLRRSKSYHNIGVICQGHQMFGEAIEAYKESLRLNPSDDETRYNLALCKRQQKEQEQQQNQENQKDDQSEQKKEEQQENQQQKPQPQPQKDQMSKENAEQLLQAVMQNEKETQDKLKEQQTQPKSRRLQKNW